MNKKNWLEILNWQEDQVEDLRLAGFAYIRQGKYDIALDFFEALIVLTPHSAYDWQTLGAIYLETGSYAKAVETLQKALKIEPNHAPTLLNITKAYLSLGKKEQALKLCDILKKDKDPQIASMARALLLANKRQPTESPHLS